MFQSEIKIKTYGKSELYNTLKGKGIVDWSYRTFSRWLRQAVFSEDDEWENLKKFDGFTPKQVRRILDELL